MSSKFCAHCGTNLPFSPQPLKFCTACGKSLTTGLSTTHDFSCTSVVYTYIFSGSAASSEDYRKSVPAKPGSSVNFKDSPAASNGTFGVTLRKGGNTPPMSSSKSYRGPSTSSSASHSSDAIATYRVGGKVDLRERMKQDFQSEGGKIKADLKALKNSFVSATSTNITNNTAGQRKTWRKSANADSLKDNQIVHPRNTVSSPTTEGAPASGVSFRLRRVPSAQQLSKQQEDEGPEYLAMAK